MDIVCFRTLGGSAAHGAKLGTGPAERCCDDDLAGSNGTWGNDLGVSCRNSRSNWCLDRGCGSVPAKSASDRPTFDQLYAHPRRRLVPRSNYRCRLRCLMPAEDFAQPPYILFCSHESSMVFAACSAVVFPAATSALTSLKTRPVSGPSN